VLGKDLTFQWIETCFTLENTSFAGQLLASGIVAALQLPESRTDHPRDLNVFSFQFGTVHT
jgi:hypothetical protein